MWSSKAPGPDGSTGSGLSSYQGDVVTAAQYVASGPRYPGETADEATTANTLHHLAGHMATRPGPGRPQVATRLATRPPEATTPEDDETEPASTPAFDHAGIMTTVRDALRPGAAPTTEE